MVEIYFPDRTKLSDYLKKNGTVPLIANWNAGSYKITAQTFGSTVATGTAPFTVNSSTIVTNLNAALLNGYLSSSFFIKGVYHSNHVLMNSGYGLYHSADSYVSTFSDGTIALKTDAYVYGNMSALSITDRTPFYSGDAISEIMKIKGKNGEIDHTTLPKFVQKKIKKEGTKEEQNERDIGAMLSMLTVAVQQLTTRIESLERKQ